jgi:uncharacterized protein (TIGR02597 family)
MKTYTYSILAALFACGMAQGAATAYTTPVGYLTLDIPANSDSNVGQPFIRGIAYQGVATSVVGSVVNLPANAGLTVNQFVYSSPSQPNSYYLQVDGGSLNGRYFDVVSNTATSITVDNGTTDISSVVNVKVIPFWTLNTLFPGGAGVGTSLDELESNGVVQFRSLNTGINRPSPKTYFHYTGVAEQGTGWYDLNDLSLGLQNDLTIDPYIPARVRNQGFAKTATITGTVPTSDVATPIVTATGQNDNYLTVQFPTDVTLAESGLSAVLTPSTDILDAIDVIQIYNETAPGINKPVLRTFFYYTGIEEQGTGFYDNDNNSLGKQDDVLGILKAGRVYTIRRAGGTPGTAHAVSIPGYDLP